ncbi:antirestriction protein [Photobacterium damselae]|nr:antirestriction protein [Photobacterium damselae]
MITERIVPENERCTFYPSISPRFIHIEAYCYHLASKYVDGYNGGYWEFVELHKDSSSGVVGRYASLVTNGTVRLVNPMNYSDVTLSSSAAGIALFMMLYSDYANILHKSKPDECEYFSKLYFQLKDYACEHHESDKIFAFLD